MPQMKCPKCGAPTLPAMGRSYCARCGWNRDAAQRRYVRVQWVLPILIAVFDFMGVVALGIERHNWPGAILFATLPTLLLGFVYAGVRQGLARLRAPLQATDASAAPPAQATEASAERDKSERYSFLLSLPPPRPVRLSRRGKMTVNLSLLFVFGVEAFLAWTLYGVWYRAHVLPESSRAPEIFLVCFMVLVASLPFLIRRGMARDLKLMENGAVALGRVTEQRNFKNASAITYEFEDAAGRTVTGSGNDLTRSFYPSMTVPVFYDPQNSKRSVAACSSFVEVPPRASGR